MKALRVKAKQFDYLIRCVYAPSAGMNHEVQVLKRVFAERGP